MLSNKVILSTTLMFMCANIGLGALTVYLSLLSDLIAPDSPKVYGTLLGMLALGEVIGAGLAGSLVLKIGLGLRIALAQTLSGAALTLLMGIGFGFVGGRFVPAGVFQCAAHHLGADAAYAGHPV